MKLWNAPLLMLFFALPACDGGELPTSPSGEAAGRRAAALPAGSGSANAGTPIQRAIAAALADAVARTGLAAGSLKVAGAERVVWPDGSLGCAEPGVVYTMAPVPGFRIVIDAASRTLAYHASEGGYVKFCPHGQDSGISAPGGTR